MEEDATSVATRTKKRRGRPGYDLPTLIESSVEVFHTMGFDGTSMEDLSKHLGISKSAIYHHVASKDELLGLALNRALDALDTIVAGADALSTGPLERTEWTLRESVVALVHEKPFVALLLRVRGNTEVERSALERRRHFDQFLAGLVEEAAAEGLVNSSLDPRVSARLLFGMVNSLTDWVHPGSNPDMVADTVVTIAFTGLVGCARDGTAASVREASA